MKTLLKPLLAALCLLALSAPAMAQVQTRAYAPEDLRTLSYNDQVRVIRQEYLEQSGGRRIADDQLRFYIDQVNRSNWRFSDIKRDIAKSLGGDVYPPGGGSGNAIRCESTDNRNRTCPTPWRGYSRLSRQLSKTRCVEGQNWSSRNGEVSVWGGCRAEFVSGGNGGAQQAIECHSKDNDARRCPTPWRGTSRLVRQISNTTCVEGRNWSSQDGLVIVWKGCRAAFSPAFGVGPGPGPGNGYTVSCASQDGRYATCNWPPGQGRPRMVRQLSRQPCIEGRTWGMAGSNRIWVNGGCRAVFGN